jgi:hypothetical protein
MFKNGVSLGSSPRHLFHTKTGGFHWVNQLVTFSIGTRVAAMMAMMMATAAASAARFVAAASTSLVASTVIIAAIIAILVAHETIVKTTKTVGKEECEEYHHESVTVGRGEDVANGEDDEQGAGRRYGRGDGRGYHGDVA